MALGVGSGGGQTSGGGSSTTRTVKFKNINTTSAGPSYFGGNLYFNNSQVKVNKLSATLTSKGSSFRDARTIYLQSSGSGQPYIVFSKNDAVGTSYTVDCSSKYANRLYITPSSSNNRNYEMCTFDIEIEYQI